MKYRCKYCGAETNSMNWCGSSACPEWYRRKRKRDAIRQRINQLNAQLNT